jgi:hypothetical protein
MADFHSTDSHSTDWTIRTPTPWWAAPHHHQPQPPPSQDKSLPPRRTYHQYVTLAAALWHALTRRRPGLYQLGNR